MCNTSDRPTWSRVLLAIAPLVLAAFPAAAADRVQYAWIEAESPAAVNVKPNIGD